MHIVILCLFGPAFAVAQAPARWWLERFALPPTAGVAVEVGGSDAPMCSDCVQLDLDASPGVTHARGDARRLPFADGAVDLIITKNFPWNAEFLEYLREDIAERQTRFTADVLREYTRVLAPGGRVVMMFEYIDDAEGKLADPRVNFATHLACAEHLGHRLDPLPVVLTGRTFERPPDFSPWPERALRPHRRQDLLRYLEDLRHLDGTEPRMIRNYLQGFVMTRARPGQSGSTRHDRN